MTPAALSARLLSGLYECLLLAGTLMLAGFVMVPLAQAAGLGATDQRRFTQLWMLAVIGGYFCWFWTHGGQTLPMKTWRIRVCRRDGAPLALPVALLRLLLVVAGWGLGGAHFAWALIDRERQFLHDRLLGTRIVRID